MQAKINEWLSRLDLNTNNFKEAFSSLDAGQLNWKPTAQTWSIAQNIEHLIIINETYYPVIQAVRNKTYKVPFLGKFNFATNFFGNLVLKASQPDRSKKIKTFSIWEPTTGEIGADILDRFENHQSELKEKIMTSLDLLERGTVISSPANRNIVYRLATAFDIIVVHEERHLEQAKEVWKLQTN